MYLENMLFSLYNMPICLGDYIPHNISMLFPRQTFIDDQAKKIE